MLWFLKKAALENGSFCHGVGTKSDYSPVSWNDYFEMMDDVVIGSGETKDISFTKTHLSNF